MLIDIVTGPLPFCFFGGNISSNHRKRKRGRGQWHIFFLFLSQSGKMFAKNLSCVQNLPPTPCPAPPTLHLIAPESACLLTLNPPLLNTFDIYEFVTALAIAFDFVIAKIVTKKHDKDICAYVHLHRARTDPG